MRASAPLTSFEEEHSMNDSLTPGLTLLDRFHVTIAKIGISPKIADPVILALVGILVSWIVTGTFDAGELRIAAGAAIYAALGIAAPPAPLVRQDEVDRISRQRVSDSRPPRR